MKKTHLLSVLTAITVAFSAAPAKADLVLGADFTRSHFSYKNNAETYLEDNYNSIGPVVGISMNGFGIEGYYKTYSDSSKDDIDSKVKIYGADFVLQLPTNEYIDFVGSVGYAKYEFEGNFNGLNEDKLNCHGPRFGLGMQINLNRHIGLRAMYHYTSINSGIDYFDSINEMTAGIRLRF